MLISQGYFTIIFKKGSIVVIRGSSYEHNTPFFKAPQLPLQLNALKSGGT